MDDTRWLDDTEAEAWRAWLDTYRLLLPAFERQLQDESNVSFSDYEVLVRLSEAPGRRLRMSQVADETLSTRSGVTRSVTRLELRGWVRRVDCVDDRRGMFAELTDAGQGVIEKLSPGHVTEVRRRFVDLLTPAQLRALIEVGVAVRAAEAGRPAPDEREPAA